MKTCPAITIVAALFAALTLTTQPAAGAVIIFNNLAAGSPNGSFGVSNRQSSAQSFSTTSSGFILSEVALRLWNQNGTSGNFELQVWDALGASGRPGAQVGSAIYTGLAQNLGSVPGSLLTVSGLNFTLVPDTTYYMVAAGTSLADIPDDDFGPQPGTLYWDATNVLNSDAYDTSNSGVNWNGPYSQNLYTEITAVPEPSTYALLLMAGAGWLLWKRRKATL